MDRTDRPKFDFGVETDLSRSFGSVSVTVTATVHIRFLAENFKYANDRK